MPHQNLIWVDWYYKIYFNFFVQLNDDVLDVLGTNMLESFLPLCYCLISRSIAIMIKDVVA